MGKETKIGLAVVGVLLIVFGTLLFRKLAASGMVSDPSDDVARAPAALPSSAGMADKPHVIRQTDSAGQRGDEIGRGGWASNQRDVERTDDRTGAPRAVYMPDDNADDRPRERYARDETPASDDGADAPAAHADPFHRRAVPASTEGVPAAEGSAEPGRLDDAGEEPSALNHRRARGENGPRNPLRAVNAELPLDDAADANQIPENQGQPASGADLGDAQPHVAPARDEDQAPADSIPPADPVPSANTAPPSDFARPATQAQWQNAPSDRIPSDRGPVEAALPENGKYTVQPNDNLWSISEKVYGTGRYFKALREHNRSRLPSSDKLAVGTIILVPPAATLDQNYPTLCPKQRKSALVKPRTLPASTTARPAAGANVYAVAEGDTLFDIARYELGKASRWAEIYELNRETLGEDFDYLQPGTQLAMPARSHPADSFTRQRDSNLQR
jgi:nucleoid-associated protein YgaU